MALLPDRLMKDRLQTALHSVAAQPLRVPTLEEVVDYFATSGVVGEEKTCLLSTLLALRGQHFILQSRSGSGKTKVLDTLLSLLPSDRCYVLDHSTEKALLYDASVCNKLVVVNELQKASSTTIELLKTWGEDKTVQHVVTLPDKRVVKSEIPVRNVVGSLAIENAFSLDEELSRRYVLLATDVSAEQTSRILQALGSSLCNNSIAQDFSFLHRHVRSCFSSSVDTYINPFFSSLSSYFPSTLKSRSYASHYARVMEAVALYHYPSRVKKNNNLFLHIDDVVTAYHLFHTSFISAVLGLPLYGRQVLSVMRDEVHTPSSVHALLADTSFHYDLARSTLQQLLRSGFVSLHDDRKGKYVKLKEVADFVHEPDWEQVFVAGCALCYECYPERYDEWYATLPS